MATILAFIFGSVCIGGFAAVGLGFGIGSGIALFNRDITGILIFATAALLFFGMAGFFAYLLLQNYQWVELDGNILRGRRLLTRRVVEQRVEDITEIRPLKAVLKDEPANILMDAFSENRGYEIRFRSGSRLAVFRWDMTDVDGFIEAVRNRRLAAPAD